MENIIGTRNLLIHAYDQVDTAILGGIVERDIPELAQAVERMLQTKGIEHPPC